ncbi:uncharacterized protein LOC112461116 [Temnothorax curvispinosus]|uniref:Uncharacterized protein LOC112461116 n=1 Tax=Temnothorax curvispinosus TaxID=300111 RepID=A0A6J1QLR8_9HYME|nr:uncharacterized protein LOC112461116 [Temnothorax curvispinosus]
MKVDSARICSIHFEKNCYELVKTTPRLINDPVKEVLRLKKGSVPTKFLNLEKKRIRRMSQSKENNKKIKVPEKSFIVPTCTGLVQYAQQKQRLSQEETVTRMETDLAQNMEEQSKAIKQQVKQGINDNTNYVYVKTLMQLRKTEQLNRELLDENKNLKERIRDLGTQFAQLLQAEIKSMTRNKHKEAKTIVIDALHKIIERLSSEDIARADSL